VWVYLAGIDRAKGVPANHWLAINPATHLGIAAVPSSWTVKDAEGRRVGKTFQIHFVNGRCDTEEDRLGQYLIDHGFATREPWRPAEVGDDPSWRWREA
jgi:hypothetical protein